jgi:hypothetical protein
MAAFGGGHGCDFGRRLGTAMIERATPPFACLPNPQGTELRLASMSAASWGGLLRCAGGRI